MGESNKTIYVLAAIYLGWLLAVLSVVGYTPTNDGAGYVEYALWCLAEGQPYPTVSIYQQTPFVWNVGIICLTQLSWWLFTSLTPLLMLLCVLKAGTALCMALTTRQLFGPRAAVAAIVLFMLYPNNWGQSTMVSSEIPSTFLCVLTIFLFVRHERVGERRTHARDSRKPYWPYLVMGVLLALANWFRPTATIFVVAITAYLLVTGGRKGLRHAATATATMLAGLLLFIGVVGTSCYVRTGHFVYQARSYWFSMVDECYDGAPVAPHYGQPLWPEGLPRYISPDERRQMDCFDFERIWRERSLDYLKDHKLDYLRKIPGRIFYMYIPEYDNMPAFLADKSLPENNYITIPYRHIAGELFRLSFAQYLSLASFAFYCFFMLLALLGTVRLVREQRWRQLFLPLFIVVGGTLAIAVVMHGETRFKDPLMPYVFVLSGYYLSYKHSRWKAR